MLELRQCLHLRVKKFFLCDNNWEEDIFELKECLNLRVFFGNNWKKDILELEECLHLRVKKFFLCDNNWEEDIFELEEFLHLSVKKCNNSSEKDVLELEECLHLRVKKFLFFISQQLRRGYIWVRRVLTLECEKSFFYLATTEKRTCWSWKSADTWEWKSFFYVTTDEKRTCWSWGELTLESEKV